MAASQTPLLKYVTRIAVCAALFSAQTFFCREVRSEPAPGGTKARAERLLNVLDVILEHYVAPQTVQQMLLDGVTGISKGEEWKDDKPESVDELPMLAKEVSNLAGREAMQSFLSARLTRAHEVTGLSFEDLEKRFLMGVGQSMQLNVGNGGSLNYVPAKQFIVEQQLRDNRYVGIGIALSVKDGQSVMHEVFPRGPAHSAGGQAGDLILSIDEQETKGMKLEQVIDKLRGLAGQGVSVVVRQPDSDQTRTLKMVRGEVPMETVVGFAQTTPLEWDFRPKHGVDIAYLKISSIRGSTARELREIAGKLHAMKFRAVIIDLQNVADGEFRHATMIADQLLGQGPIGSAMTRGKKQEQLSDADRLFAGLPLAVLVGPGTRGQAEWIAAAIQDQHGGIVVGAPTPGVAYLTESIKLPNGDAVVLHTGRLYRANGRSLVSDNQSANHFSLVRVQRGMPGTPVNQPPTKPPPGWHGVMPDHDIGNVNPLAKAIEKLSEQLSSAQEPAAR